MICLNILATMVLIYHDSGIEVREGHKSINNMCNWIQLFQASVNKKFGLDHLQFMVEIWKPDIWADEVPCAKNVTIHRKDVIPYVKVASY